jgi:hypothetical protein
LANYPSIHSSIVKEPFPELLNRRKWYRTPLLSKKSSGPAPSGPKRKVAYTTLYDQLSKCFKAVGIRGSSVTHLPRSSGAKSLEQKGVSEDQIRRLGELTVASKAKPTVLQELTRSAIIGKWAVETMEKCYLSSISREACRAQAGFDKEVG